MHPLATVTPMARDASPKRSGGFGAIRRRTTSRHHGISAILRRPPRAECAPTRLVIMPGRACTPMSPGGARRTRGWHGPSLDRQRCRGGIRFDCPRARARALLDGRRGERRARLGGWGRGPGPGPLAALPGQASRRARLVRQNGHGLVPADPAAIQGCIDELAAEGVVLRDIDRGLVDFPAQAPGGRWYWLCWLVGEDAVDLVALARGRVRRPDAARRAAGLSRARGPRAAAGACSDDAAGVRRPSTRP